LQALQQCGGISIHLTLAKHVLVCSPAREGRFITGLALGQVRGPSPGILLRELEQRGNVSTLQAMVYRENSIVRVGALSWCRALCRNHTHAKLMGNLVYRRTLSRTRNIHHILRPGFLQVTYQLACWATSEFGHSTSLEHAVRML
jgi:hypothetical protein